MEDDYRESIHFPSAVIMVPNKELCFQVHRMATELLDAIPEEDRKIKIATATSASGTWPYRMEESPNVLICTPSFMSKFVRGPSILEEDLFRSIRHFVLDEADMLLEGSYQRDVEKLMDAFKVTRRQMIRDGEIQVHTSILQCILSAATLPSYGMRSMEKYIERMFPLAKWISNEHLHKHHPRIVQSFHDLEGKEFLTPARMSLIIRALFNRLEEGEDTPLDFLDALEKDEDGMLQPEDSTMVFVNTAEAAVALAGALRQGGIKCAEFHKLQMANDKQEGLQQFRADEIKVLVCTDHAARGLDLPHVRHVVQAEFALNVVQHLHRIGRASRAGAMGRATNIVDERSSELVDSILSDSDTNSVDQSFSRRRGFRNKIKKAIKRSRVPVQGEGNSEESVDDFFEKL
jgi:superfamily II DNA/RNA helicase